MDAAAVTQPTGRKVPTRSFQIDEDMWERFDEVAASRNRSRGGEIREFIQREVLAHEAGRAA